MTRSSSATTYVASVSCLTCRHTTVLTDHLSEIFSASRKTNCEVDGRYGKSEISCVLFCIAKDWIREKVALSVVEQFSTLLVRWCLPRSVASDDLELSRFVLAAPNCRVRMNQVYVCKSVLQVDTQWCFMNSTDTEWVCITNVANAIAHAISNLGALSCSCHMTSRSSWR